MTWNRSRLAFAVAMMFFSIALNSLWDSHWSSYLSGALWIASVWAAWGSASNQESKP